MQAAQRAEALQQQLDEAKGGQRAQLEEATHELEQARCAATTAADTAAAERQARQAAVEEAEAARRDAAEARHELALGRGESR